MPKTILIIDDEEAIVKVFSFRLVKAGYEVMSASDGPTALTLMKNKKPDLILLDLSLPLGMSGYGLCQQIKENPDWNNIPIVFFTASSGIKDVEEKIKEYHVQGFIKKPFESQELMKMIEGLIGV